LSKDRQNFPAGGCVDPAFDSQAIDIENVFRLGGATKRFFSLSFQGEQGGIGPILLRISSLLA
jgi:hypothetical protein